MSLDKIIETLKKHGLLGACIIYIYFSSVYFTGRLDKLESRLQRCYEGQKIEISRVNPLSFGANYYAIIPKDPIGKIKRT